MIVERPQNCPTCGRVIAIWRRAEKVLDLQHAPDCQNPEIPQPPPPFLSDEELSQVLIEWVGVSSNLTKKSDLELGRMVQEHILNQMPAFEPKTLLLEELCNRMIERACPHSIKETHDSIVQCAGCGKIFEEEAPQPAQ